MIEKSTTQFLAEHPSMKYLFFGGKGGVGKTVLAGASALWYAQQGRRTLLASTNPVHSLSSMLGQDVFGRHVPVSGVPNLYAYEIDTKDTIEKSKKEIREKIQWFLKYADIKTKAEEFVESATMNPAFEESAMFENMIDLMFEDKYEVYVFDTAPPPTPAGCWVCPMSTQCGSTRWCRAAKRPRACGSFSPTARRRRKRTRLWTICSTCGSG